MRPLDSGAPFRAACEARGVGGGSDGGAAQSDARSAARAAPPELQPHGGAPPLVRVPAVRTSTPSTSTPPTQQRVAAAAAAGAGAGAGTKPPPRKRQRTRAPRTKKGSATEEEHAPCTVASRAGTDGSTEMPQPARRTAPAVAARPMLTPMVTDARLLSGPQVPLRQAAHRPAPPLDSPRDFLRGPGAAGGSGCASHACSALEDDEAGHIRFADAAHGDDQACSDWLGLLSDAGHPHQLTAATGAQLGIGMLPPEHIDVPGAWSSP